MHIVPERREPASIFLIAVDPRRSEPMPWQALAVLQAADAVFFDAAVKGELARLVPPSCEREEMRAPQAGSPEIARIRRLAGDGWRLVRLIAAEESVPTEVRRMEAAGLKVRALTGSLGGENRMQPELSPAALNGAAG
jgi:siroheme synthase